MPHPIPIPTSRPARRLALAALVAATLLACGGSAPKQEDPDYPVLRALDHLDGMLDVLEAQRGDPDEAERALAAYVAEHQAAMEALRADGAALGEELRAKPGPTFRRIASLRQRFERSSERIEALKAASPDLMDRASVRSALGLNKPGPHAEAP